jgi:predicted alpha/beta-fold hydrolase
MTNHENGFRPARWLPGGHLQTMWGRVLRRGPKVAMRREAWTTPDGDELLLDWVDGPDQAPLVVVLHGLEGSSHSLYVHGLLDLARRRGWRGLALNFRSCAIPLDEPRGEPILNRGDRMYHSGETSDLDWLVGELERRQPGLRLGLIGASLGGNVLLKWLGERGESAPQAVRAAATISVPYDLAAASRHLESGFGPHYVRYFLDSLKPKALAFAERHPGKVDVDGVRAAKTFWAYDDAAVAPVHGFKDAADYYACSSSIDFVDRIAVPTLLLSSVDDPFLPPEVLPEVERRAAACVECRFTSKGGHTGFVTGPPWAPRCWGEERAVAFVARHLDR